MLNIQITRLVDSDVQVKCYLNGSILPHFFGYGIEHTDQFIESDVTQKLTDMGLI